MGEFVGVGGSSSGGSSSTTHLNLTLAQLEALTPAVGDLGKPTDSPYELRCAVAGTWTYYLPGTGYFLPVQKAPATGWSYIHDGLVAGAATEETSGAVKLTASASSYSPYGYRTIGADPFTIIVGSSSIGDEVQEIHGLYEAASGKALLMWRAKYNISNPTRVLRDTSLGVAGSARVEWDGLCATPDINFTKLVYDGAICYVYQWNGGWDLVYSAAAGTDFTTKPTHFCVGIASSVNNQSVRIWHYEVS